MMDFNKPIQPPDLSLLTMESIEKEDEVKANPYKAMGAHLEYENNPTFDYVELRKKIFEWQWYITTRKKWAHTEEDFELGIFVTGDLDHDLNMMDDWLDTTRSIAELVELHAEGKEFIVKYPRDIEKMFNVIQEYTAYLAERFSNSIYLQSRNALNNPEVVEVLKDVIKLQNLGNQLFPAMVNLNREYVVHTTGLFGFLFNEQYKVGDVSLNFDPLAKYGLTLKEVKHEDNIDKVTGLYKAINVEQTFDPRTLSNIRKIV